MTAKSDAASVKLDAPPSRPPGKTGAAPPCRDRAPAPRRTAGADAPAPSVVPIGAAPRSGFMIVFLVAGLAVFAVIRLVGAGDSNAARKSVEGRIADFERGKAPDEINYQDPVYGKAVEDLRAMANGPDGSAAAEKLLRDIEAKQRDFEVRLRQSQAEMEAKLAAQDARLAAEIEHQRHVTGTDPEAAERVNSLADRACQEEKHKH